MRSARSRLRSARLCPTKRSLTPTTRRRANGHTGGRAFAVALQEAYQASEGAFKLSSSSFLALLGAFAASSSAAAPPHVARAATGRRGPQRLVCCHSWVVDETELGIQCAAGARVSYMRCGHCRSASSQSPARVFQP
eukprot:365057-Chlamydomonas_euryale.AAC.26